MCVYVCATSARTFLACFFAVSFSSSLGDDTRSAYIIIYGTSAPSAYEAVPRNAEDTVYAITKQIVRIVRLERRH